MGAADIELLISYTLGLPQIAAAECKIEIELVDPGQTRCFSQVENSLSVRYWHCICVTDQISNLD